MATAGDNNSQMAVFDDDFDVDVWGSDGAPEADAMEIDNSGAQTETTGSVQAAVTSQQMSEETPVQPTGAAFAPVPTALNLQGVSQFGPHDPKGYNAEHFLDIYLVKTQWINDDAVNLVYATEDAARSALAALTLAVPGLDPSQLDMDIPRAAKPYSKFPGSTLIVRIANTGDAKVKKAHLQSEYYLRHPEHEPGERRFRGHSRKRPDSGRYDGSYRANRYDEDEHVARRGRERDAEVAFDVDMYGEADGTTKYTPDRDSRARSGRRGQANRSRSPVRDRGGRPGRLRSRSPPRGSRLDRYRPNYAKDGDRSQSGSRYDTDYSSGTDRRVSRNIATGRRELFGSDINNDLSGRGAPKQELFGGVEAKQELFGGATGRRELFSSAQPRMELSGGSGVQTGSFGGGEQRRELFGSSSSGREAYGHRRTGATDETGNQSSLFGRVTGTLQQNIQQEPEQLEGFAIRGAAGDDFKIRGRGTIRKKASDFD